MLLGRRDQRAVSVGLPLAGLRERGRGLRLGKLRLDQRVVACPEPVLEAGQRRLHTSAVPLGRVGLELELGNPRSCLRQVFAGRG